jgi:NADH-quinone oxidoreductase subunit H
MMVETLQQLLPGFLMPYFDWSDAVRPGHLRSNWPNMLTVVWTLIKVILIIAPLLLIVAYVTFWERKIIGWMQVRIGPNRVGPWGLIQPIADGLKLMLKEVTIPSGAIIRLPAGAGLRFAPALVAWAVIPFNDTLVLANVNASLLYIMAITSIGVYGIILAGWASNSKYAFLGGMRSAAQMVSYEVAMGLALVVVLMVSNSLNLGRYRQRAGAGRFADMGLGFLSWNWLLAAADVRCLSGFDRRRDEPRAFRHGGRRVGNRRLHVEYSGMAFAVFFSSPNIRR